MFKLIQRIEYRSRDFSFQKEIPHTVVGAFYNLEQGVLWLLRFKIQSSRQKFYTFSIL